MYDVPIERGKIREYARAAMSDNPSYDGPKAVVHPTFLTTAGQFWELDADSRLESLGFDFSRILHGQETYVFHGPPPRAGQVLSTSTRVAEQSEKEGKRGGRLRLGTIVHEFRDEAGELVAEQHTTLIETSRAVEGE